MTEAIQRYRIHSHLTRSRFFHVEDALEIGKLHLFAGEYERGRGARVMAHHYLGLSDARVLLNDLAWGKPVDYCEFKGTANGAEPRSRVLKVKTNGNRLWFRLENGPGEVMGEGAVKPAGDPDAVVNVPFTAREARRLAFAVLAHLDAWEAVTFRMRAPMNTVIQKATDRMPDRIDFTIMHDKRVIVLKFRRDTTNSAGPRDIPIPGGHDIKPPDFDLDAAIAWCENNGYTVHRWAGGARAWKGKPYVIRTYAQIQRKRAQHPSSQLDFAYDG